MAKKNSESWLAVDLDGTVYARIARCRLETARAIALVIFPDLEGAIDVIGWSHSSREQRQSAAQAILITPEICRRRGITLPGAPVRPPVEHCAQKLQKHFARAAGAG
jgi:hypothetical protein